MFWTNRRAMCWSSADGNNRDCEGKWQSHAANRAPPSFLAHDPDRLIQRGATLSNCAATLSIQNVSEMNGAGRRIPLTMLAFSIGALGVTGPLLTAGTISKARLSNDATVAGMNWTTWVLLTSSLLNAARFVPILWRAWFRSAPAARPEEHIAPLDWRETAWLLLVPPLVTATMTLAAGMLAESPGDSLARAKLIAEREYRQRAALP